MQKKYLFRTFVILILLTFVFVGVFYHKQKEVQSQSPLVFGGKITFWQECSCTPGPGSFVITITGTNPGTFLFLPGRSIPFREYQHARIGVWALGNYTPGAVCLTGKFCIPATPPPIGTIHQIGTSF